MDGVHTYTHKWFPSTYSTRALGPRENPYLVCGLPRSSQSDGGDHQQQKVMGFVSEGTGKESCVSAKVLP